MPGDSPDPGIGILGRNSNVPVDRFTRLAILSSSTLLMPDAEKMSMSE